MDLPAEKISILFVIVGIAIWTCLGVWAWAFLRRRDGLPVLPVAWRRPVPWRGIDLVLFIVGYLFLSVLIAGAGAIYSEFSSVEVERGAKQAEAVARINAEGEFEMSESEVTVPKVSEETGFPRKEREHEVTLALRNGGPWMIGLCFFMAVIFAPISEEIVFRMFIQGYLEKVDGHLRVQLRRGRIMNPYTGQIESQGSLLTILPWGVAPILITSGIFAMMHFRIAKETPPIEDIRWMMVTAVLAGTISVVALLFWLRLVRGAQLSDFGIVPREIPRDIFRGLMAFFAIAAPVYAVQITAASLVPEDFAPDPISIFVLSVAFGTVWCRTHRLVPSIVMHMCLNATSMGLAMYVMRGAI